MDTYLGPPKIDSLTRWNLADSLFGIVYCLVLPWLLVDLRVAPAMQRHVSIDQHKHSLGVMRKSDSTFPCTEVWSPGKQLGHVDSAPSIFFPKMLLLTSVSFQGGVSHGQNHQQEQVKYMIDGSKHPHVAESTMINQRHVLTTNMIVQ